LGDATDSVELSLLRTLVKEQEAKLEELKMNSKHDRRIYMEAETLSQEKLDGAVFKERNHYEA